jgi:3-dehydroquinate dehydratase type I
MLSLPMKSVRIWSRRFWLAEGKWRICAAIVDNDLKAVGRAGPMVDFFEVRIDLIGSVWRELVAGLDRPWIACNRRIEEGGRWQGSESERIRELIGAVDLGATIVDIELAAPDVASIIGEVKDRAELLISYHNLEETPSLEAMQDIVERQLSAGADICKVVTTARDFADNIAVLQLISSYPDIKIVAFAMGPQGYLSRVLSPLAGGYFTYASIEKGRESAAGQIAVRDLMDIYQLMEDMP